MQLVAGSSVVTPSGSQLKDTPMLNDGTDLAKLFTIPNNPDSSIQVVASSIEQEVGELKIQMPVFQASASYESYLNPLKNERRVT